MMTFEIATDHVILTPLDSADAPALFAYRSLPEVSRYQGWEPQSLDDVIAFVDSLAGTEFDTPGTWFQFAIHLRDSRALIGDLGVRFLEDGGQAEVGFTLAPASQGKGLASEALAAVLDHLFGRSGKHRVFASVDPRNHSSVRLLRRIGMRQEAHLRESLLFKGEWVDDMIFAILASEWRR